MYNIIIKGEAGESYPQIDDRSKFDGIDCDDEFSEYFHGEWNLAGHHDRNEQDLIDKGVKNGYMRFKWEDGKLYVIVEYNSKEKLTNDELNILIDYTQGQMSDGIGEGFEQFPCYIEGHVEYCLSPWFPGQILVAEQIEKESKKDKEKEEGKVKWYSKGGFKKEEEWKDESINEIDKIRKFLDELKKQT